ncbi:putative toxin-antitoxin system toxin component, PIN family [bacterium]|nr:putative toxin-antitoxin system toxin component, PIN family [bacterium]
MKVVIDTNVFVSGVFFGGPPYLILDAWRSGKIEIIMSTKIFEEYLETGKELSHKFPNVALSPWMQLILSNVKLITVKPLKNQVCSDPDDDKFIACAISGGADVIVTGDKALLAVSGFRGIQIVTPRMFLDHYLARK